MLIDTAVVIVQDFVACLDGVSGAVCTGVICDDKWLLLKEAIARWVWETQLADLHTRS